MTNATDKISLSEYLQINMNKKKFVSAWRNLNKGIFTPFIENITVFGIFFAIFREKNFSVFEGKEILLILSLTCVILINLLLTSKIVKFN